MKPEFITFTGADEDTNLRRYWIDMESGVRDGHDRFSLTKCRAVCEAVYSSTDARGVLPSSNDQPKGGR